MLAAHLACTKVSQPPLVQMWVLSTRIIVSLLQIALSTAALQEKHFCTSYHVLSTIMKDKKPLGFLRNTMLCERF